MWPSAVNGATLLDYPRLFLPLFFDLFKLWCNLAAFAELNYILELAHLYSNLGNVHNNINLLYFLVFELSARKGRTDGQTDKKTVIRLTRTAA